MQVIATGAHLGGGWLALGLVLAAYLIIGQPLVGSWSQQRLRRTRADPRSLLRRYRRTAALEWALVAVSAVLVAGAPGLTAADVGLRWPRLAGGAAPYTVAGAVGLAGSLALLAGLRYRIDRGAEVVAPAEVLALIPRTTAERRAFASVSITAGVCEEVLYRGLLLAVAVAVWPDIPAVRLVLLSGIAFGLAHAYQGVPGMLTTAVLGASLAVLYVGSGSLLLPVLYHVLVDLRVLVLAVGRRRPRHGYLPS